MFEDAEFNHLLLDQHGTLAIITLRRAPVNAISTELLSELAEATQMIIEESEIEAVIITGDGDRAFAAGADIQELTLLEGAFAARDLSLAGQDVFQNIATLPIPTVAVLNGATLGGGLELALACDVRIAHPKAVLGFPEVHLGLIPGYGGTQRLPRMIGAGRALELMLSGRHMEAQEAERCGLVHYVQDRPLEFAREYLGNMLSKGAPMAFGLIKEAVRRGLDTTFSDGLELEADLFGMISTTKDAKEGTQAFLEKRKAQFLGE